MGTDESGFSLKSENLFSLRVTPKGSMRRIRTDLFCAGNEWAILSTSRKFRSARNTLKYW